MLPPATGVIGDGLNEQLIFPFGTRQLNPTAEANAFNDVTVTVVFVLLPTTTVPLDGERPTLKSLTITVKVTLWVPVEAFPATVTE